jgi:hypothetical protein
MLHVSNTLLERVYWLAKIKHILHIDLLSLESRKSCIFCFLFSHSFGLIKPGVHLRVFTDVVVWSGTIRVDPDGVVAVEGL